MNALTKRSRRQARVSPRLRIDYNNDSNARRYGYVVNSTFTPGFETYEIKPGNVMLGYGIKIT